ncbi:MAG: alpha/beta hydrolase [Lachnospiraceae bacterium]|nr:alpha/beta hydrolase [Lachnospiraceae bacterium]
MDKVLIALLIVVVIVLVSLVVAMLLLARYTVHGKRQSLEEAKKWQSEHYDISWYDELDKYEYIVRTEDKYKLHVQIVRNPNKTDKYVILSHGYTDNRYGTLKYMAMYMNMGYNCIIYDLRGHGLNKRQICTYTIQEAKDLSLIISDTYRRYENIKQLGLHGESLGGATSVACLKYNPLVNWVVDDCGFADLENVLKAGYGSVHLPADFTVMLVKLGIKMLYHMDVDDMKPVKGLSDNKVPILCMHGEDDTFIVPENSLRIAQETGGYSEVHMIEKAGHAASVLTDPIRYEKFVKDFLKNINAI